MSGSAQQHGRTFAPRQGGAGGPAHGLVTSFEKAKHPGETLKRLLKVLHEYRLSIIVLAAIMIVISLLNTAVPWLIGKSISVMYESMKAGKMNYVPVRKICAILTGCFLINSVLNFIVQKNMALIAQKSVLRMRRDMDEKLTRLPLSFFDGRTHGEIMSRLTNDVDNISNALHQSLPRLITSLIGIFGAAVMMLVISPLLTIITILTLPMSFMLTMAIAKKSQQFYKKQQRYLGELNGHIEEMFSGHTVVKLFGYENKSIAHFSALNNELYMTGWKSQFITGIIFPSLGFISNLGYVAVCVAGGVMVARRALGIGDIQAFLQYIRMFTQPVMESASIINILQSAIASAERIFELEDEAEQCGDTATEIPPNENHTAAVAFHNVTFGYGEKALFKNLSFAAQPGQTVAIVGPTGAGKTTLVNLLMRFYEISQGSLALEGTDIRNMRRGTLRRNFGMVLQETWLFRGTVRDNIAYAKENCSLDEVITAAKAAHAHHFICLLSDGYDTMLNDEASNISQGEKQLLTIARAILANPRLLILDEATSSVDTRTELLVQHAMRELMRGRTCFVIAHRLSTIRDADLILVINNGAIIEQGTHKSLLSEKGFYSELYQAQFSDGTDSVST